jgi:2-dehydro-3-deoxyphosphogluconate aldolase/(4S)-4-hydroxy-2-oxoglutarate aldolase
MGGLKYLRSFAAPYKHLGLRYIPLGGVNASNMSDYLKEPMILAVGGSWIAKRDLILNKDFKAITNNAIEARKIADQCRKGD